MCDTMQSTEQPCYTHTTKRQSAHHGASRINVLQQLCTAISPKRTMYKLNNNNELNHNRCWFQHTAGLVFAQRPPACAHKCFLSHTATRWPTNSGHHSHPPVAQRHDTCVSAGPQVACPRRLHTVDVKRGAVGIKVAQQVKRSPLLNIKQRESPVASVSAAAAVAVRVFADVQHIDSCGPGWVAFHHHLQP